METKTQKIPIKKPAASIIVFADYACPLSYIGVNRLAQLHKVLDLAVDWRFIESRPQTPPQGIPTAALGMPPDDWRTLMDNLARMAEREKLPFREPVIICNSRKAILLSEAARTHQAPLFGALHARLFTAYFGEGRDIGDEAQLWAIASEVGVTREFFDWALKEPLVAQRLSDNQATAQRIGLKATPAFMIGDQVLEGPVPTAMLAETLVEIHEPH